LDFETWILEFSPMLPFFLITLGSFALSLSAKFLADAFLSSRVSVLGSFAGLRYSLNPGIAFGIRFPWGLESLLVPLALILVTFAALKSARTQWSQIGFGLIVGGALGNVIDRIGDGVVTDFFQVSTLPIFNVADSCITVGVVVLLLEMIFHHIQSRSSPL
jgi:signal peptidase II